MPKFSVTGTVVRDFQVDVDAKDEEQAIDKVERMSHMEFHGGASIDGNYLINVEDAELDDE